MTPFLLDTRRAGGTIVLIASGELDETTTRVVSIVASAALSEPEITRLELDLSDVPFLDRSALTVLRGIRDCARDHGKSVGVGGLRPLARESLDDAGLASLER